LKKGGSENKANKALLRTPHKVRRPENADVLLGDMMKKLLSVILLISAGCAGFKADRGDMSAMLVTNIQTYGGTVPASEGLRPISCSWEIKTDSEGFIVRFPPDRFQDVDQFLRGLFGAPQIWSDQSASGHPHGVFSVKQIGVAIQYFGGDEEAGLICVRPQNWTSGEQNKPSHRTAGSRADAAPSIR